MINEASGNTNPYTRSAITFAAQKRDKGSNNNVANLRASGIAKYSATHASKVQVRKPSQNQERLHTIDSQKYYGAGAAGALAARPSKQLS